MASFPHPAPDQAARPHPARRPLAPLLLSLSCLLLAALACARPG